MIYNISKYSSIFNNMIYMIKRNIWCSQWCMCMYTQLLIIVLAVNVSMYCIHVIISITNTLYISIFLTWIMNANVSPPKLRSAKEQWRGFIIGTKPSGNSQPGQRMPRFVNASGGIKFNIVSRDLLKCLTWIQVFDDGTNLPETPSSWSNPWFVKFPNPSNDWTSRARFQRLPTVDQVAHLFWLQRVSKPGCIPGHIMTRIHSWKEHHLDLDQPTNKKNVIS